METLWDINEQILSLLDDEELRESDPQCFKDTFEALSGDRSQKIIGYIKIIKSKRAIARSQKEEGKKLLDRAKINDNAADRLEEMLCCNLSKREKFECEFGHVSWRKSTATVTREDVDIEKAPEDFVKVTKSWKKTALKAALESSDEDRKAEASKWATLEKKLNFSVE